MNATFFYALLAAICYGIAPLFEKKGLQVTTATDSLLLRAAFIAMIMIAYCIGRPQGIARYTSLDKTALFFIFGGAIFGVMLAQLFYFKSLEIGNVSQVIPLVTSMQMIVSVILATLVYHEPVSFSRIGGIALIISGIYLLR